MTRHIPWFNPREMDDETVLALATGRDSLLDTFLNEVDSKLLHPSAGGHWLVTGTRGAGKSYFLRLAESRGKARFTGKSVRFVLLPEELPNLRSPHDLLDEIRRMLRVSEGDAGRAAQWNTTEPGQAWIASLKQLLDSFSEDLLVVGIENFHEVIETAFATEQSASMLRKVLENEPRLLLLVTAIDGSFDEDYTKRLFKQFKQHPLAPWDSAAHRQYLILRAGLLGRKPTPRQLAQIDAYSRYTGGNARVAAVLAAALLDDQNLTNASSDLNATLDEMTDYYRELHRRMPANTRNLFDALVRGGEPCSQTQLAERVGAKQSEITKAFGWMIDANYLITEKILGQKNKRYKVADRLFVQWYRMRYLEPGQRSRLAVMAELLAETVAFGDKWRYAKQFQIEGQSDDALLMSDLGFKDRGVQLGLLKAQGLEVDELVRLGERMHEWETKDATRGETSRIGVWLSYLEQFPCDELLKKEMDGAFQLASACNKFEGSVNGKTLAERISDSDIEMPLQRLFAYKLMLKPTLPQSMWDELASAYENNQNLQRNLRYERECPWSIALGQFMFLYKNKSHWANKLNQLDRIAISAAASTSLLIRNFNSDGDRDLNKLYMLNSIEPLNRLTHLENSQLIALQIFQLTEKIPKNNWDNTAYAHWLTSNSTALSILEQEDLALEKALQTLNLWRESKDFYGLTLGLSRVGWGLAAKGNWSEAYHSFEQALSASKSQDIEADDWDIGQAARCQLHLNGLTKAWEYLCWELEVNKKVGSVDALQQLGDAVWDIQRTQSDTDAYALARQILHKVANQNQFQHPESIRKLFIGWFDIGVKLDTLLDLIADLPTVFNTETGSHITALAQTLGEWMSDLKLTATERALARQQQDPDLVTTLDALNESLSTKTRVRLGLMEQPRLSPEGESIFRRICAFIR